VVGEGEEKRGKGNKVGNEKRREGKEGSRPFLSTHLHLPLDYV
jgi:hypothetical protein